MSVYAEMEINTYRQGGAIAGVNFGTVKYCASAGSINANGGGGTRGTGGIVGSNYGSVEACCSSAAVHNDYRRAGGIVGYNDKEAADMDAHGTWNNRGTEHISAESTTFIGSVADCFFVGYASSASREYSGGIAASNDAECTIVNCYWLDGSSADNWGYYQEAEGATGVFDSEGIVAGSGKSLLEALNNDAFAAGDHFPRLWWASSDTAAAEPAEGEEGPAEEEASALAVCGADTALDALKAYETSKTLVKAGKNGETEVEAKGITATDLIEKIGDGSAAATLSLTFTAADGFSAKVDKPEAGWDEVMLLWEGDGASDESLKSAVNYGGGKVWVNGVVTVEAEQAAVLYNGQPLTLDALKAYETAKTLVKSGKNGETEIEVKGITASNLITKVMSGSAETTLSLTFTAADGFSAKVDKPEAGWDEVMLLWEGDGASDESLRSAVNFGGGKVWVNGVVTIEAEGGKEVCLTLCLKQGDGEAALLKEYSKEELLALTEKNEAGGTRLSMSDAFRSATGEIRERIVARHDGEQKIYSVYCLDNEHAPDILSRELVKETLNQRTNHYEKLANIRFDKKNMSFGYGDVICDEDVDAMAFCRKAEDLFELYQRCVNRRQIETICVNYLRMLEATKVTGTGHNYFVPRHSMSKVDAFEGFMEALNELNKNDTFLTANSFCIIDDAKQRDKMTEEFYSAVKREISEFQERADYLIKSGSSSPTILERWVNKISTLEGKKRHYEEILRRELDGLDDEFDTLKFLSQELSIRVRGLRMKKVA